MLHEPRWLPEPVGWSKYQGELPPQSATRFLAFNAAFQHANIATPRWLGYLVQRPESHAVHHAQSVHHYNFSDLPLWDMVFGTFVNPEKADFAVGFWKGASAELGGMLTFQPVWRAPSAAEALTRAGRRGLAPVRRMGIAALVLIAIAASPLAVRAEPAAAAAALDPIVIEGQQRRVAAYRTVMAALERARSDDPAAKDLLVCERHMPTGSHRVRIECMTNEGWEHLRLATLRGSLGFMKTGVGRYPTQPRPMYVFNPTELHHLGRSLDAELSIEPSVEARSAD